MIFVFRQHFFVLFYCVRVSQGDVEFQEQNVGPLLADVNEENQPIARGRTVVDLSDRQTRERFKNMSIETVARMQNGDPFKPYQAFVVTAATSQERSGLHYGLIFYIGPVICVVSIGGFYIR